MVAGLALRTWAVATLGRWFTLEIGVAPAQRVVDEGPYRVIRHPSYAGALLAFAGSALLLRAWVAAALGTLALGLAYRRRILQEERVLRAELPGYAAYMARTGALVPRVWRGRGRRTSAPGLGRDGARDGAGGA
jgi:protein-S-isoprenylcysteine O-methyltransferase Ste14